MKVKRMLGVLGAAVLAAGAAVVPSSPAMAAPTFRVPFHCGQVWSGETRTYHSPAYAIDFNRANDFGDHVLASAAGTVDIVADLKGASYGRYVRINHGGGWTTYYAHLSGFNVSVGQWVGASKVIGYVGNSGNSDGAHLHYEQRLNGGDVPATFGGGSAYYWGTSNYQRVHEC